MAKVPWEVCGRARTRDSPALTTAPVFTTSLAPGSLLALASAAGNPDSEIWPTCSNSADGAKTKNSTAKFSAILDKSSQKATPATRSPETAAMGARIDHSRPTLLQRCPWSEAPQAAVALASRLPPHCTFLRSTAFFMALIFHVTDSSRILVKVPAPLAEMLLLIVKTCVAVSD